MTRDGIESGDAAENTGEVTGTPSDVVECQPDLARWTASIGAAFESHCGDCHGATVNNGAPFSLVGAEDFLDGNDDVRKLVAKSLAAGTMPPPGLSSLGTAQRQAMLDWVSCSSPDWQPGNNDVNAGGNFDVNRTPVASENRLPPDTDFFEMRADEFVVPEASDTIECFTFRVPVSEERFVKRVEVIIDEGRVLHHAVVMPEGVAPVGEHVPCEDANALSLVYGWAPGQGALEFPEGGLRVKPGDLMTVQIHYNNRAGFEGVKDSSGVRFYHGPPEGKEYSILTLGTLGFNIPAQSVGEVPGWCRSPADMEIFASFPHMHEKGISLDTQILRASGEEESLIDLSGWSFDYQYFYDTPTTVAAGDVLKTTCQFRNDTDEPLRFGTRTQEEMCFNFVYVSPPPPITYCNQRTPPIGQQYEPGECAPVDFSERAPSLVTAQFVDDAPPELTGGDGVDGVWAVSSMMVFVGDLPGGAFDIDLEQSRVDAYGLVHFSRGEVFVDMIADIQAVAMQLAFSSTQEYTFSGPYEIAGDALNQMAIETTCGEVPNQDGQFAFERKAGENVMRLLIPVRLGPINLQILANLDVLEREI